MTGHADTPPQLQPYCEVAARGTEYAHLHGQCSGTVDHRLPWQSPTAPPLFTDRCDCACHRDNKPPDRSQTPSTRGAEETD